MSTSRKFFTIDPSGDVVDLVDLFIPGNSSITTGCKLENGNDIGTIFAPFSSTGYKLNFQTQFSSYITGNYQYTDFTNLFAAFPFSNSNNNGYIKTTYINTTFFDAFIFDYQGDRSSPYNTPVPTPGKCSISFNLGSDTGYMSYLIIGGGGGGAAGKGNSDSSTIAGQGGGGGGIIYDNTFNLPITSNTKFDIQVGYGGGGGIKDGDQNTTFYGGIAGDSYLKYNRNNTDLYLTSYGGFPGKELNAATPGQGGNVSFTYSTQNSGFINTSVSLTNKIGGGGGGGSGSRNNFVHTDYSTEGAGGQNTNTNGNQTNAGGNGSGKGGNSYFVNSNISITLPFKNISSSNDTSFVYGGNGGGGGGWSQGGNQGSTAGGAAGDTTFGVSGARVAENAFSGYTGSGSSGFYYGNGGGGGSYLAGNGSGGSGGPGVVMLWWFKSIYKITSSTNIRLATIWSIVNNQAYNGVIFELSSDSSLGTASIQFTSTVNLSYLIIGGGGGGGQGIKIGTGNTNYIPGLGGGGGGIFYSNNFDLTVNANTPVTIQVGNGGSGSTYLGTSGDYSNYLGVSGVESNIKFSSNQLVASGGTRGGGGVNANNNLIKGNGGIATYTGSLSMTNKGGGGGGGGGVQTNAGGTDYANYAGGDGGNYLIGTQTQTGRQGTSGTLTFSYTYQGTTYTSTSYGNGGTSFYNNTPENLITLPFSYTPNVTTTTTNVYCGNGGSGGTMNMGGKAGSTKGGVQVTTDGNSASLMYGETPYSGYTGSGTSGFYYGNGGGGAAAQHFYSRKDYPRYGGNGGSGVVMLWWKKT